MKVTVVKNWNGTEEIHKAGCADLKRNSKRPYRLADAMTMEATGLEEIYRAYWECIDQEAVDGGTYPDVEHAWYAWQGEFSVKPCASGLASMDDPDSKTAPASKREAAQELARWLVDLVAANASERTEAEQQKLANWLHSLPTGGDGPGPARYWPEGLTRPSQTDWR